MPPPLSEIQTAWTAEFPGTSVLLVILRAALALADWRARQIQAQFQQLHQDLYLTGLPLPLWDSFTHRTYLLIQRHHHLAQREFHHALAALQASYKKAGPVKPPPPPTEPPGKINFPQTLVISVENDSVTTTTDTPANWICAIPPDKLEVIGWFTRQYHFNGVIVPPCYSYLLTYDGVTHPPKLALSISYRKDHFLCLCRQELETGSPVPIDDLNLVCHYAWSD